MPISIRELNKTRPSEFTESMKRTTDLVSSWARQYELTREAVGIINVIAFEPLVGIHVPVIQALVSDVIDAFPKDVDQNQIKLVLIGILDRSLAKRE